MNIISCRCCCRYIKYFNFCNFHVFTNRNFERFKNFFVFCFNFCVTFSKCYIKHFFSNCNKISIFCNKVSFTSKFNYCNFISILANEQASFRSSTFRTFCHCCKTFFFQRFFCFCNITVTFCKGFFAFHHTSTSFFTKCFYISCCDCHKLVLINFIFINKTIFVIFFNIFFFCFCWLII